jgi:hypothetical protein
MRGSLHKEMEYISQRHVRASGRTVELKPERGAGRARLGIEEFRFEKRLCNEKSTMCSLFVHIAFNFALLIYLLSP